ncbi:hypothetical protein BV22DRAFT_544301 [Leucogyrophana mollusca]|uniref:Uncharacterized protein n=1 Tax=Leucogyrophana mollusca TaxID=85980 RepID=A0ACB8BE17_9AGAM|nr:hypothetical protein BV22DRAFT_544301 [Leucogyrophana mollusca]
MLGHNSPFIYGRYDYMQIPKPCDVFPLTTNQEVLVAPYSYSAHRRTRYNSPQRYVSVAAQVVLTGISRDKVPMIARVSITDYRGNILLDTFVRPTQPICDYRHAETGLQFTDLMHAPFFHHVQTSVAELVKGKIIVGHAIWNFLSVMGLNHPAIDTRDLALFLPFRRTLRYHGVIALRVLVKHFMERDIGAGYEHPLEIARASIDLFRSCETLWEEIVHSGSWPCALPSPIHAECFS